MALRLLVLNGPNLNLLGTREPEKYGLMTLAEIEHGLSVQAGQAGATLVAHQANGEGELVTLIQTEGAVSDGIIINPGGYTHTSVAIRDAILAISVPVVEVHVTNPYAREPFRHKSLISDVVVGRVMGFGPRGYAMALDGLLQVLGSEALDRSEKINAVSEL